MLAPASIPGEWLAEAQAGLARREYEPRHGARGWQAPNRAQNLRTYFSAAGVRLVDRTAAGEPELARLSLCALGRTGRLVSVPPGELAMGRAGRMEIRRAGVVEWYENRPEGLEQGFALEQRPEGSGELRLALQLASAQARAHGAGLVLKSASGRALRYDGLVVNDATGKALEARLELSGPERIEIAVDDRDAVYPLLVDPLISAVADATFQTPLAFVNMGGAVASAGDVNGDGYADVLIGASGYDNDQGDEGAAFVFLGGPAGIANGTPSSANTVLEGNQNNAFFGSSVAGAGDVNGDGYDDIVVGASGYDSGETDEGAALVFLGGPSGIASGGPATASAFIQMNQASASVTSAAGAGDVNGDGYADVLVSAQNYDLGETDEGIALVYLGGPSGIANGGPQNANATLQCNQASCLLGHRVASAGDVNADGYGDVVVTAQGFAAGQTFEGGAFVFLGGPAGIASGSPATAHSTFQTNQVNGGSGLKAAAAGDVNGDGYGDLIVGSNLFSAPEGNEGAAFVLLGGPTGIPNANPATANTVLQADLALTQFGSDVASAGDVNGDGYADVLVGAFAYDGGQTDEGAAFVFLGGPSGIASGSLASAFVKLESNQASASYGGAVASAGDVNGDGYSDVLVGASGFDGAQTNGGAAFLYLGGALGSPNADTSGANTLLQSNQASARFGISVAGAGDVNGDGYADAIVGAHNYDAGENNEGAAFVFLGGPGGIQSGSPATAAATLQGNQASAFMGASVAGAGDVNGDGYADVIVGASLYSSGQSAEGAAFVFLGGPAGIQSGGPATASAMLQSDLQFAHLGASVAGAGDVNGDGYADVVVGAESYGIATTTGAAFVFLGGPSGILSGNPATASATLVANQFAPNFGASVASAGDVNGDGYSDVIVGAWLYDAGETDEGAAFVFLGGPTGIPSGDTSTASATLQSNQAAARFGWSVASAGDVNGDGYADVIVGALFYDAGEAEEGAAFVFLGGPSGVQSGNPATAHATFQSNWAAATMGSGVASAGDVNGDGYADVIVGANRYALSPTSGAAFVFLGGPSGLASGDPTSASATLQCSTLVNTDFGQSVAGAGDVDGDGFADVIVGAPGFTSGQSTEGTAFVFLGNRGRTGRAVLARQLRAGSSTPVQPFGLSQSGSAYQQRITGTSPSGRRLLAREIEACPSGSNWGAAGCVRQRSGWSAAPSGVALLADSVSGLISDRLYRWRARVLYGPSVQAAGVTPPPNPPHGPWRRLDGQAREADIRTSSVANLSVNVADTPDPVIAGQTLRYTLAVSNAGPSVGRNLVVTQTLPPGLTFLGASGSGWSCLQFLGNVTCTRPRLEASTGGPIVVDVVAPASGGLYTSASVTGSSIDPFAFDDFDDETTQVTPLADLSIVKSNGQTVLVPGAPVTYTIVVANAGPANALGAAVTDALPGALVGASWTCAASSGSSCPSSGSGSIANNVNVLAGGTLTYTLSATVAVSATGVLTNVASVGLPSGLADPLPGNNSAQDSDPLTTDADLGIGVSDGLATATPGLPLTYTLTVTNAGPPAATGVTVSSPVPGALSGASWTCVPSAGAACTPGPVSGNVADVVSLPAGGTLTYTLQATVKPSATGSLTQQASVTPAAGHSDPSLGNNTATDTDTLVPQADLALTLGDAPDPLPVFGSVTYTLGAQNAGPSDATGATLVHALPAGLAFVAATPGCTNAGGTVTCALGGLPAGQARTLTVTASAAPGTLGTLSASATLAAPESDPDTSNNARSEQSTVKFVKGDLDNDLQTDLVLRNVDTGIGVVWLLNGVSRRSSALVTPEPQGLFWQIAGVDDFDGDHRNDLLLRDELSGAAEFWLMGGATGTDRQGAALPLAGSLAPPWRLSATADFNHDQKPDLVWRNFETQKIELWTMDGTARTGTLVPTPDQAVDLRWEIVGAQDWNADGNTDFLWYNPDSGKIVLWFMDATVVRITGLFTNPTNAGDNNWKVLAMGDYGLGQGGLPDTKDIVWRNATSGNFVVWYMDAAGNRTFGTFTSPVAPPNPLSYTIVGPR